MKTLATRINRGFILPVILIAIALIAFGGGTYFAIQKKESLAIDVTTATQKQTTETSGTAEQKPSGASLQKTKLANLYVTPKGTPTLSAPSGWKTRLTYDLPLKAGEKVEYRTLVTFTSIDKSQVITYQLLSDGGKQIDQATAELLAKDAMGVDTQTTIYSQETLGLYGLTISEFLYKNPTPQISSKAAGSDDPMRKPDFEAYEIVARIFYIPGHVVIVTGASAKESTAEMRNNWFNEVFASVTLPSVFNGLPNGIPIGKYMSHKAKFDEVARKVQEAQATPKGTLADFSLSACYPITETMSLGDTDASTKGQVSSVQKMLFERYKTAGTITGRYDDLTMVNVIRFQREIGLEGSGGVGSKTISALNKCIPSTKITITAPNGGEVLKLGDTFHVAWFAENVPPNAQLDIALFEIKDNSPVLSSENACLNCIGGGLLPVISALYPVPNGPGGADRTIGKKTSGGYVSQGNRYILKAVLSKTAECPEIKSMCEIDLATDWSDAVFTLTN